MGKGLVKNYIDIHDSVLVSLGNGNSVTYDGEEYDFVESDLFQQSTGYRTYLVVFMYEEKYFRFMKVVDVHGEVTNTEPHEVFREEHKREYHLYSSYVEVKKDINVGDEVISLVNKGSLTEGKVYTVEEPSQDISGLEAIAVRNDRGIITIYKERFFKKK